MARIARVVIPGLAHLVTQRGVRPAEGRARRGKGRKAVRRGRRVVFASDADRRRYLELLAEYAPRMGVTILAYCLMRDHVHLVAVPRRARSLARLFRSVHRLYVRRVNRARGRTGGLWQSRFASCPLDSKYMWAAVRHVETNPVRAGAVTRAERYPWSSARGHCGRRDDPIIGGSLNRGRPSGEWAAWLRRPEDPEVLRILRVRARTGRPAGSPEFMADLERRLGRSLAPRKPGPKPGKRRKKTAAKRPKKTAAKRPKKRAGRPPKKPARKTARKKLPKRAARKPARKAVKRPARKAVRKPARKPIRRAARKPARKVARQVRKPIRRKSR